jgi:hypothetical protein
MEVPKLLKNRRLATGVVLAAGALGIGGCTSYETAKTSQAPVISPNKLTVNIGEDDPATFSCDGYNLRIDGGEGDTTVFLNDPACSDKVFTIEDLVIKH